MLCEVQTWSTVDSTVILHIVYAVYAVSAGLCARRVFFRSSDHDQAIPAEDRDQVTLLTFNTRPRRVGDGDTHIEIKLSHT
jgi:hypothetical protein